MTGVRWSVDVNINGLHTVLDLPRQRRALPSAGKTPQNTGKGSATAAVTATSFDRHEMVRVSDMLSTSSSTRHAQTVVAVCDRRAAIKRVSEQSAPPPSLHPYSEQTLRGLAATELSSRLQFLLHFVSSIFLVKHQKLQTDEQGERHNRSSPTNSLVTQAIFEANNVSANRQRDQREACSSHWSIRRVCTLPICLLHTRSQFQASAQHVPEICGSTAPHSL